MEPFNGREEKIMKLKCLVKYDLNMIQDNGKWHSYIEDKNTYFYLNGKEVEFLYNRFQPISFFNFKRWATGKIHLRALPNEWLEAEKDFREHTPIYIPEMNEEYRHRYLQLVNRQPLVGKGQLLTEKPNKENQCKKYEILERGCVVAEIIEYSLDITEEEYQNILAGDNRINK